MLATSHVLPNLLGHRAEQEPDRVVATDIQGRVRTYGELHETARRWTGALTRLGVGAGNTVLVMQPTAIEAYEIWIGIALMHGVEVPINTQYLGNLLVHVVNDSRAAVMVVDGRYLQTVLNQQERFEHLRTVVVTGAGDDRPPAANGPLRLVDGAELLAAPTPAEDLAPVEPWEIATILYTSGTTGPSKGVLVTWAQSHATCNGLGPARTLLTPKTAFYQPYPTFHVSGKCAFHAVALGGGRIVVRERFDTRAFWSDVREYGCTYANLTGATANFIEGQPPRADDADNPLVAVFFSPWTPNVEAFKERFDVEGYSAFNMTEISCPIVGGWDNEPVVKPKSCGRRRDGYDLRIVDEHDVEVPPGTRGELIIRADEPWAMMAGYWQMPEKTVEAWRNQWFHTGDMFMVDKDGDYFYLDRNKDAIRRRGESISSMEIEGEVLAHPDVLEAAAVAVEDDISGEEVKIVVVLHEGRELSPEDLIGFVAERVPRFMVPRYVEFLEALPKTPTQKILKSELRAAGITDTTWDRQASTAAVPR